MTAAALLLILVSVGALVAGELLLKHAMQSTVAGGFRQRTFAVFLLSGVAAMSVYPAHAGPAAAIRSQLRLPVPGS
jgi:hypothetical protein